MLLDIERVIIVKIIEIINQSYGFTIEKDSCTQMYTDNSRSLFDYNTVEDIRIDKLSNNLTILF
ncbi:hypothetical protein K6025_03705 [Ehrlichia sp. JZT12]